MTTAGQQWATDASDPVTTYVALMRDEYPPFRLEQGQYEPGHVEPNGPTTTPRLTGAPA